MTGRRKLYLVLISVAVFSLPCVQADDDHDDDDCQFFKSLSAKKEMTHLNFPTHHRSFPRDRCIYWKIVASQSEAVEVQVSNIHWSLDVTCEESYLKLVEDSDLIAEFTTDDDGKSTFSTKSSDLMVYFRSGGCLRDFKINYRSISRLVDNGSSKFSRDVKGDDDDDDEDNNDVKSSKIGFIIGGIVGLLLVLLLVLLLLFLVRRCTQRKRASAASAAARDSAVAFHFWSKPSGYAQAGTAPASPTGVSSSFDLSSKKAHPDGADTAAAYTQHANGAGASPASPPPYSGRSRNSELSQLNEEPPPCYTDAVYGNKK